MPELAEVELARRTWLPALNQTIITTETHPRTRIYRDTPASTIESALTNSTLTATRSHGKRLLFTFRKNNSDHPLEIHLGMSGRLSLHPPDHQPHKHDHLLLRTPQLTLAFNDYRQFGRAHLHPVPDPWSTLPPEILSPQFTVKHLASILCQRPRTSLKALLLDQNHFPGIGNWMADEICWRLLLHPATPTARLDPASLRKETRFVTRGALKHVADRNDPQISRNKGFSPGSYVQQVPPENWLFQHRWRPGGNCPRCHSALARDTIANRTTAWCPTCQPAKYETGHA